MFDMVVRDQLLRPQAASSRVARLSDILGIRIFLHGHPAAMVIATVLASAALLASAYACWRDPSARVLVGVLAMNMAVLLVSPSYFAHYAELTAAPAALVLGVALGKLAPLSRHRLLSSTAYFGALAAFLASGVGIATTPQGSLIDGAVLARAAPAGCVTSDDPQILVQMNRLSSDLRSGCRVAIDVTGITYDSLHRVDGAGRTLERAENQPWQHFLYTYLMSGRSFVIARRKGDGIDPDVLAALRRQPPLARSHDLVLRRGDGPAG
jgi:hypothetical protein